MCRLPHKFGGVSLAFGGVSLVFGGASRAAARRLLQTPTPQRPYTKSVFTSSPCAPTTCATACIPLQTSPLPLPAPTTDPLFPHRFDLLLLLALPDSHAPYVWRR